MELSNVTIASSVFASMIQKDYKNVIGCGRSDEEAFAYATRTFQQLALEDICTAYCALALIMHQLGRLNDAMKDKVIKMIDAGGDLSYWESKGADEKTILKRQKELQKVKEKLLTEMDEPKKVMKPYVMRCDFHVGDLIAYPLHINDKIQYVIMIVVSLQHKICEIPELSYDQLYVCFHDTLWDEIPDELSCKELRYKELMKVEETNKKKKRLKRLIRNITLSSKVEAKQFYDACTIIGRRYDLFEKIILCDGIEVTGKQLNDYLVKVYEENHGNSEKHLDYAYVISKTKEKVKHQIVIGANKSGKVLLKGGRKAKETWNKIMKSTKEKMIKVKGKIDKKVEARKEKNQSEKELPVQEKK